MTTNLSSFSFLLFPIFLQSELNAEEKIQAYFSNDSVNGLMLSDAYETHNMGLVYTKDNYYVKFDLGIVSPDMYVYRNKYREANRSFGELISLEIGQRQNNKNASRFYARIKATGEFGVDHLQDLAHRILSLQQVNKVNELIRMPADAWIGIGLRDEFQFVIMEQQNTTLHFDCFLGSDTAFLYAKLKKEFNLPVLTYEMSIAARFVAYDEVVSAFPINAKERGFIPEVSFGITYKNGPYSIFIKDSFSLPSIETDSALYGLLSAGVSYEF